MQVGTLNSVMGDSRLTHEATINSHNQKWKGYMGMHKAQFLENNLKKYRLINAEGEVIDSANDGVNLITNANGTVRHEDFLVIQDEIVEVRRRSLNGITDLKEAGLSFTVALSDQMVGFENINEFQEAKQEMNPTDFQNNDTVFTEAFVPNPITHQSFSVPWRQQGFDYKRSLGMSESMRQVAEKQENTLFNGNANISVNFSGQNQVIFGYTTHPNRGTGTISDWSLVANIELIIPELIAQVGLMWSTQGGVANDSVVLYLANDIWTNFQNDYKADSEKSVFTRAMDIPQIKAIKPAEKLAAKEAVLVEMLRRTIQLASATSLIVVPHTKIDPMAPQVLTTYAAEVQQIKSDSKGNTGIRHLSQ